MTKSNTSSSYFELLKKRLKKKEVSFIIGAGFSKNVSPLFLDWTELLRDMILDMYKEEIEGSFYRVRKHIKLEDHQRNKIQEIINRIGYLGIASEYVRRKGYHEAIDIYIEERVPFLRRKNGQYSLIQEGREESNLIDVSIHKQLIDLNAKYIYTFNYDNLLDVIGGTTEIEELTKEIDCLSNLYQSFSKYKKLFQLEDEKKKNLNINTDPLLSFSDLDVRVLINELKIEIDSKSKEVQKDYSSSISFVNSADYCFYVKAIGEEMNNIQIQLDYLHDQIKEKYRVIDCSSDISLTENQKSIFKLHGTIRRPYKSEEYGFDNCFQQQYVITQEDYDTYPREHEAFVNLMRIALLRGTFCIIGFSADDPNFLSWLSWVGSVLKKKDKKEIDNKFFYINATDEKLTKEKQLLFSNHNISVIYLSELFPKAKTIKEKLLLFLKNSNEDNRIRLAWEKIYYEKIGNLMDKANDFNEEADILWESLKEDRMPLFNSFESHSREALLFHKLRDLIKLCEDKISLPLPLLKIIIVALKNERQPIDVTSDFEYIRENVKQFTELQEAFDLLDIRSEVLINRNIDIDKTNDDHVYERVLQASFRLDFVEVKKRLDTWVIKSSSSYWNSKRLALLSFFDRKIASEELEKVIKDNAFENIQERIYALEICRGIRKYYGTEDQSKTDISNELGRLKRDNPSLHSLRDNIDYLTEKLNEETKNIYPYGTIQISYGVNNLKKEYATKLLQSFLEIGLPFHNQKAIFIDKTTFYILFKELFLCYPYPCLYFALQYANEDQLIRRIAQDYTYSSLTEEILNDMLNRMLLAHQMKDTPDFIKRGILKIAPVFMGRLRSSLWEDNFIAIYNNFDFVSVDINQDPFNPIYDFFVESVNLIGQPNFRTQVICDCLKRKENPDHYNNQLLIAALSRGDINLTPELNNLIDQFIEVADTSAHFYILLNLDTKIKLKHVQKNNIIQIILNKNDDKLLNNSNLLLAFVSLYSENEQLVDKVKSIVLNSSLLWFTGLSENGYSYVLHENNININKIQEYICFNSDEISRIYTKLKISLQQIAQRLKRENNTRFEFSFNHGWSDLLRRMQVFILKNKSSFQEDYSETASLIQELLDKESDILSIFDALSSNDVSKIEKGLSYLFYRINYFEEKVNDYKKEYLLIISNLILKNDIRLKLCLQHLEWTLTNYMSDFEKTLFQPLIEQVFIVYIPYYSEENQTEWGFLSAEKGVVEKTLLMIYKMYKKWGETIDFWENYKSKFY